MGQDDASVSRRSRLWGSEAGLAQASHSGAAIWLMDETASRVISDEAIDDIGPVTFAISHQHVVTTTKIVHCGIDFKSTSRDQTLWLEPLKDHLIGVAGGACPPPRGGAPPVHK